MPTVVPSAKYSAVRPVVPPRSAPIVPSADDHVLSNEQLIAAAQKDLVPSKSLGAYSKHHSVFKAFLRERNFTGTPNEDMALAWMHSVKDKV